MEFSINSDKLKSGWSIVYIEGLQDVISKKIIIFFYSLKIIFVLANNANPDEMPTFCYMPITFLNHISKNWEVKVTPYTVNPVLSGNSKRIPKLVFMTNYCFMQVKSIAECSNGSILQYFRPLLSYHLS